MSTRTGGGFGTGAIPRGRTVPGGVPGGGAGLIAGKGVAAAWDARAQGRAIIDIGSEAADVGQDVGQSATVLLLVEDRLIRKLLSEALAFFGLDALGAADFGQAETLLRANRPDVVVLESRFSRHRAGTVSGWVAARPGLRDVPIVVLTGWSAGDNDRCLRGLDYQALIPGPISVPRLFRSIGDVLDQAPNMVLNPQAADRKIPLSRSIAEGNRCSTTPKTGSPA